MMSKLQQNTTQYSAKVIRATSDCYVALDGRLLSATTLATALLEGHTLVNVARAFDSRIRDVKDAFRLFTSVVYFQAAVPLPNSFSEHSTIRECMTHIHRLTDQLHCSLLDLLTPNQIAGRTEAFAYMKAFMSALQINWSAGNDNTSHRSNQ
jgi:hypothetical protein